MSATHSTPLHVAICQCDIKFKQVDANKQHISQLLSQNIPSNHTIDFLLFPEMTLSGYVFKDKQDIFPFCERAGQGAYFEFGLKLAKQYNCTVFIGFPEKELINHDEKSDELSNCKLFNSMYVISHNGNYVTYRKHFLFEADTVWAEEGESFKAYDYSLNDRCILIHDISNSNRNSDDKNNIRIGVGICMDIDNGTNYCSDINLRELTTFHNKIGSDILMFMCNWFSTDCLEYWFDRLQPMISKQDEKIPYFVSCNRIGNECGIDFCGMSCVYNLSKEKQELNQSLIASLPQAEEAVKIVDLCVKIQ